MYLCRFSKELIPFPVSDELGVKFIMLNVSTSYSWTSLPDKQIVSHLLFRVCRQRSIQLYFVSRRRLLLCAGKRVDIRCAKKNVDIYTLVHACVDSEPSTYVNVHADADAVQHAIERVDIYTFFLFWSALHSMYMSCAVSATRWGYVAHTSTAWFHSVHQHKEKVYYKNVDTLVWEFMVFLKIKCKTMCNAFENG
jgi:hypothetical protein